MNAKRRLLLAATGAALVLLAIAGSASAHQIRPYEFLKSFDGHDSTGGAFTNGLTKVAINQSNGRVYVLDSHLVGCCTGENWVSQFNTAGQAQAFTALAGVSSFSVGTGGNDMVFDNTGHNEGLWVFGNRPKGNIVNLNPDGSERIKGGAGNTYASCGLGIDPDGFIYQGSTQWVYQIDPNTGFPTPSEAFFSEQEPCSTTFDSQGYAYLQKSTNFNQGGPGLYKYSKGKANVTCCIGEDGFDDKESLQVSYVPTQYSTADLENDDIYAVESNERVTQYTPEGAPIVSFGAAEGSFTGLEGAQGVAVDQATKDVYVTNLKGSPHIDVFKQGAAVTVPDTSTQPAAHPDGISAVMKGVVNPDGVITTDCKFEWGTTTHYLNGEIECAEGNAFDGSADQDVSAAVGSLTTGQSYHYRVASRNADGYWSYSSDRSFEASTPPTLTPVVVDRVNTDGARFTAQINPRGGTTHYHFEFGTQDCESNPCSQVPVEDSFLKARLGAEQAQATATGLTPDTGYYVRLVAENGAGDGSYEYFFHTYPSPPSDDHCANALVRQQVSASLLPDCRAYELVSAGNAGGYEVESSLVPGQTPYQGYPSAPDRVLYGLHFGSIPGVAGDPPNYGVDPYLAERTDSGWATRYVGIPAGGMADRDPYGSPVLGADSTLDSFAFGGPGICDPCFQGDGTNIPLRLHEGAPTEGMAGSLPTGESAPAGGVAKYLSADGEHLVFGSTEKFEEAGVAGAPTIYERDLGTGVTTVVSTDSAGATLSGPDVSELDLSSDGSRVLIAKKLSSDAAGNDRSHLYMHVGTAAKSLDLTPGATSGVLFSGMTADGSRVFYTTTDKLSGSDTDQSADIYEVDVAVGAASAPRLVTTSSDGAPSNSDACAPSGSPNSWNSASGDGKCSAVAFAGGAGVAARDGTFYFVSPEQLDGGEGEANEANLYVVRPGGNPTFVGLLDSSVGKIPPAPQHPVVDADLTGGGVNAEASAVDQATGDIYVDESGAGQVSRFEANGSPHNFSAGPGAGTNHIAATLAGSSESQIDVDGSSGILSGDLYVTEGGTKVSVFSSTGAALGTLTGVGTSQGSLGYLCGVTVDQSTGAVYTGDYNGNIWRYLPKPTAAAPIDDSDYTVTGIHTPGFSPCQVAAGGGRVYGVNWAQGPVKSFSAASFAATPTNQTGTQIDGKGNAVYVDPSSGELHVDQGSQVVVYSAAGELVATYGGGAISGSRGIAVNGQNHHSYVPSNGALVEFGYLEPAFSPVDNPAIVDGVRHASTRSTADFQVTPGGAFAVFSSLQPLTGFSNLGHMEVFRYDAGAGKVECASCPPSGAAAKADTVLAPDGIDVTEDGRVFFTSAEGMVLSDTNEHLDVYEWSGGTAVNRISSGSANADSSLLTASEDGVDVYFFTRQVLVPEDENGGAVKIYDAREGGGFPVDAPTPPCAASDECHGPGTQAAPAPDIRTITGAGTTTGAGNAIGGEAGGKSCRKGTVKRHGKCVKKHKKRRPRHSPDSGKHG